MTKKTILHSLIAYEFHRGEVELVLKKLGVVPNGTPLTESRLYCWLEDNPTDNEIKLVLTEIGYDVSML